MSCVTKSGLESADLYTSRDLAKAVPSILHDENTFVLQKSSE